MTFDPDAPYTVLDESPPPKSRFDPSQPFEILPDRPARLEEAKAKPPRSYFTNEEPRPQFEPFVPLTPNQATQELTQFILSPPKPKTKRDELEEERDRLFREQRKDTAEKVATRAGLAIGQAGGELRRIEGGLMSALPLTTEDSWDKVLLRSLVDPSIITRKALSVIMAPITGETRQEAARRIAKQGRDISEKYRKLGEDVGGGALSDIIQPLATTAGVSAPIIPAAVAGGLPASATLSGLQSMGSTFDEATESYKSRLRESNPTLPESELQDRAERKAFLPAYVSGAITTAVTSKFGNTGIEAIRKGVNSTSLKAIARDVFKQAGLEATEEMVDQVGQDVLQRFSYNPDKTVGDSVKEVLFAGGAGLLLGGGVTGVARTVQAGARIPEARERSRRLSLLQSERQKPERRLTLARRREEIEAGDITDQIIQQQEAQDATQAGTEIEAPRPQVTPEQEAAERLRLRNDEKARLEAAQRAKVTPEGIADELGFTFNPTAQAGAIKLEGLSTEERAQLEATVPKQWEFTDRREDSPTKGMTFYVPEGASREDIFKRYNEKLIEEAKAKPAPITVQGQTVLEGSGTRRVPRSEMALRPDLMQFKDFEDAATGETAGKIQPPWNELYAGKLLLWEPKDPKKYGLARGQKYIVANGHHRVGAGDRMKVPGYDAQIIREADGYTAKDALRIAAETNIADGKGTIYDQVRFFRNIERPRSADEEARARSRVGAQGREAADIAFNASDEIYDLFINEKISPEAARAIANAAPKDGQRQSIGIQYALRGERPDLIRARIEMENARVAAPTQTDMFGNPVFSEVNAPKNADKLLMIRRDLQQRIQVLRAYDRNPQKAREEGVTGPAEAKARLEQLQAELDQWNGEWWLNEELRKRLAEYGEESPTTKTEPTGSKLAVEPKPEEPPPKGGYTKQDLERLKELRASIRRKLGGRTSLGVDPTIVTDLAEMLGIHVRAGFRTFKTFAQKVKQEMPDAWPQVKGLLRAAWEAQASETKGMEELPPRADTQRMIDEIDGIAQKPVEPSAGDLPALRAKVDSFMESKALLGIGKGLSENKNIQLLILKTFAAKMAELGKRRWEDVTPEDVVEWRKSFLPEARQAEGKQPISSKTVNSYVGYARRFIEYLEDNSAVMRQRDRLLSKSTSLAEQRLTETVKMGGKKDYISNDDDSLEKLLAPSAAGDWTGIRSDAVVEAYYATGLRNTELRRLKLNQVDLEKGWLRNVKIQKFKGGDLEGDVPLTEAAVFALRRYIKEARPKIEGADSEWLFPSPNGGPIKGDTIGPWVTKRAKARGVTQVNGEVVTPHTFRRSIIQHLRDELGLSIEAINRIVPHADEGEGTTGASYLSRDPDWEQKLGRKPSELRHNRLFLERQRGGAEPPAREASPGALNAREQAEYARLIKAEQEGRALSAAESQRLADLRSRGTGELFGEETSKALGQTGELRVKELRDQAAQNDKIAEAYDARRISYRGNNYEMALKFRQEAARLRKEAAQLEKASRGEPEKPKSKAAEALDLFDWKRELVLDVDSGVINVVSGLSRTTGRRFRELSVDNIGDLVSLVENPSLGIRSEVRAAMRGLLNSGLAQKLPAVRWAITDYIEGGMRGEYDPQSRIVRFLEWSKAETPVHEFFHHVWYFLKPEDREFIRALRIKTIREELGKARNYTEIPQLEEMLRKPLTSDDFFEKDFSRDIYQLSNEREFFVWMMTERATQRFIGQAERGFISYLRQMFRDLWQSFRRALKLNEREEQLWQDVVSGRYEFSPDDGKAFAEQHPERQLSPGERPEDLIADRENAKITYASLEIPRIVRDQIEDRRAAASRLEAIEYDTAQYRAAKKKIDELVNAALNAARLSGDPAWEIPENTPRANDPYLAEKLQQLGVEFNPEALTAMQNDIAFEKKASTQFRRRVRLKDIDEGIARLQSIGMEPDEYTQMTQTKERLERTIRRVEMDPERSNSLGVTVDERSKQIESSDASRPDDKAKADSLWLPFVKETFVDPLDTGERFIDQFGEYMQGFKGAMGDPNLPYYYKAAIAERMWRQIYQFDINKSNFGRYYDAERKTLANTVRSMERKLAEARIKYGMAEVLLSDVLATAKGERGLTGSWESRQAVEFLQDSYGAVIAFANNLRTAYPNGGAEALLLRILSGLSGASEGRFPAETRAGGTMKGWLEAIRAESDPDMQALRRNAGITDEVLSRVLYVLSRSDRFEYAFNAILRYGQEKVAADPAKRLERIAQLLDSGDEFAVAEATDLIDQMANEARTASSAAEASIRYIGSELQRTRIALGALESGKDLFDSVGGKEYDDIKRMAEGALNVERRMILNTGGDPSKYGQATVFFRKFGDRAEDLRIRANDSTFMNESNFLKIRDWYLDAEKYVAQFRDAEAAWMADPTEKSPEQLGFDRATYEGLERELSRQSAYQDPTILYLGTKKSNLAMEQAALTTRFFRQFSRGLSQVNGQMARQFQSASVGYFDTLRDVHRVWQRHRLNLLEARKAALDSHPEFDGDLQLYQRFIFNQVASEGRKFGSALRPKYSLPVYGKQVTVQDIAFLKAQRALYDDLRGEVSERAGRGVLVERGSEAKGDYDVMVRRAASVGDYGLPMVVGDYGSARIEHLQRAYAEAKENLPTAAHDLRSTDNPVLEFWNSNPQSIIRHILDSGRAFRALTQEEPMVRAERRAAAELLESNDPNLIRNLDDAVALIAKNFPDNSGLDVRRYVADELLAELQQYYRNARSYAGEASQMQKTEGIGGRSLRSEFTQEAAQFMFPSDWYDFGAVSDRDYLHLTSRIMSEPILELTKAGDRLVGALEAELEQSRDNPKALRNYQTIREAERVKQIVQGLIGDFKKSWDFQDPDVRKMGFEFPPDIIKAGLLAGVTVGIRNWILGGSLALRWMMGINRYSRLLAILEALRHIAKVGTRVPLDIMFSPNWPVGREVRKLIDGPLRKAFPRLVEWMAENIVDAHIHDASQVQYLGFSIREPFLKSVVQTWRDIGVYQDTAQAQKYRGKLGYLRRGTRNVLRTGAQFYKLIGAEWWDKIINSASLGYTGSIERMLYGLAKTYGEAHSKIDPSTGKRVLNDYNPSKPEWLVTPDQFSNRLISADRAKNLAEFREFLTGADISLEPLLWEYYKRLVDAQERGAEAPAILSEDQMHAMQRAVLRRFNAGDAFNRPLSMSNSKWFRMLATFQGYPTNFLLEFISAFGGTKDQKLRLKLAMAVPTMMALAVGYAIIGLISQELVDWWKRTFQGATQRQVTLLTKEFWTRYEDAKEAVTSAIFSNIPYFGDAVLFTKGMVVNNRGYEPTGRILAFGIMNSAFNAIRGMWNLSKSDPENMLNPLRDFVLQYAGLGKEIAVATSPKFASVKEYRGAEGAIRYRAQLEDLLQEKPGNVKPGIFYGPTSGIREDLQGAMIRQDSDGLQNAFQKLVSFYDKKGIENPEKSATRDIMAMQPIVHAMGGKKPTSEEYEKIYSGLTSEQRKAVDKAVSSWQWAADQLGLSSYQPIRGAAVGGGAALTRASLAGGSRSRGRIGRLRLSRTRGRRRGVSLRSRRLRVPRLRLASRRPRRLGVRRPRLPRIRV